MRLLLLSIFLFYFTLNSLAVGTEVCPSCKVKSIQQAVKAANAGDTLLVRSGTYREANINIDKPLTLIGDSNSVIDVGGQGQGIVVNSNGVNIEGLTISNVGASFVKDDAAIRLVKARNCRILNNHLVNTFFGIYLQESAHCFISGNKITGDSRDEAKAGNAIHVWKADGILISFNEVTGHRDGIYFEFVNNSIIMGNISRKNLRYGLHFMFSNDDRYEGNRFEHNGAGVAVMFSKRIIMKQNEFTLNRGGSSYGLLLKEISDGTLSGNIFRDNTIGIYAEGANRLQMIHNDFVSNGKALDIKGNCLDNRIDSNNFVANTFEVFTNSKQNQNSYSANYWSQYDGYDLDRNGIGDLEYRPVNLFAMITDKVPSAAFFLHSLLMRILELIEKLFPQMVPATLTDKQPKIKPYLHDTGTAAFQTVREATGNQ